MNEQKKKQILTVLLLAVLCLSLCGCKLAGALRGDVSNVARVVGEPTAHTKAAVNTAMDVVVEHFRKHNAGCTLDKLYYDEAHSEKEGNGPHWKETYKADEVIVILGDFRTGDYGPNVLQAFSPNDRHTGFGWVVCRYGTRWKIKASGYA
jgi:hypothetical protein